MEDNKDVVVETTENVDVQPTEEVVEGANATTETEKVEEKRYSEAELEQLVNERIDTLLPKKLERAKARMEREYENKYSQVENVLNAGLGTKNLEEATSKLTEFYKSKGVNIPEKPTYSQRDMELLANAEADDIIKAGYEDIVYEVDRLADKGIENMTPREKLVFKKLAEERQSQENATELSKLGVGKEILEDSKFKDFTSKLNPNLSLKEKYEMYEKFNPKPEVKPIGSMKGAVPDKQVKDYYTPEEARRLTSQDLDDPQVMAAVERSMAMWYKGE